MRDITIAITAASYSGNKGAAAMLQSSISQLKEAYGARLNIKLMSVYPSEDRIQCPHDFVEIIPAQPQRVVFLAFPCAVLYHMFRWCPPLKALLLKNKILKTYTGTDLSIDEAGIAFSDSRGFVMNTYAFICMAIPLLVGVPVVKYSQALGPFHNAYNRFLAKWILPKAKIIIARGRITYQHLHAIGIRSQVRLCADGAFTMPPAPQVERRVREACGRYGFSHTVAVSVSSVVERKCRKAGIDYCKAMSGFILYLIGQGYQVYLFANAARIHSSRPRNNDLLVGDAVYKACCKSSVREGSQASCKSGVKEGSEGSCKSGVKEGSEGSCKSGIKEGSQASCKSGIKGGVQNRLIWEHREMDAEEIRAYIGQCELLVASRFHAMVFALSEHVPVMLIGWSHKYQEVMEQFGLGEYAADFSGLSSGKLRQSFVEFERNKEEIRDKIREHLPAVKKSSGRNIQYITEILNRMPVRAGTGQMNHAKGQDVRGTRQMNHAIDLDVPDRYIGRHLLCRMGYAADAKIRANAASGGMVTALLCSLLKNHDIDGALVVRTAFKETGEVAYKAYIAATPGQVRRASSSVYMEIPMSAYLERLRQFDGRVAVVLTPCRMRAFCRILENDARLRTKVVLKIGLFCSGSYDKKATEYALDKCHIPRGGAKRLYYRRGHWRGHSSVLYKDGRRIDFSYTKSVCAYRNAYFFVEKRCLACKDQFAEAADISFGDVWLPEVRKEPVKYTGCVVRSQKAYGMLLRAEEQGDILTRHMSDTQMLRSQMRALTFKYRGKRWNHRLAGWLAERNRRFSAEHPGLLKRVPMKAVYYYMCAVRVLLSW